MSSRLSAGTVFRRSLAALGAHPLLALAVLVGAHLPTLIGPFFLGLGQFYSVEIDYLLGGVQMAFRAVGVAVFAVVAVLYHGEGRLTVGRLWITWTRRWAASSLLALVLLLATSNRLLALLSLLWVPALLAAVPAAPTEDLGLIAAGRRSWRMSRGHRGPLSLVLLFYLLLSVALSVLFSRFQLPLWLATWVVLLGLIRVPLLGALMGTVYGELLARDAGTLFSEEIDTTAAVFD